MINLAHSSKMATESLKSAKLRSALTSLGIIIGIAAVIATFTLGSSFSAYFSSQINDAGSNFIVVMETKENVLRDQQMEVIKNTRGISDASPVISTSGLNEFGGFGGSAGTLEFMGEERDVTIYGVSENYIEIAAIPMYDGFFLNDKDTGSAVVGKEIAEEYFKNQMTTRNTIQITLWNNETRQYESRSFSVKGIAGSEETNLLTGSDERTAVYIPLSIMQEMTGIDEYHYIYAKAESIDVVKDADEEIKKNLARNLGISERDLNKTDLLPFQTLNQVEMLEQMSMITDILQVVLVAIGGISLIVGSVGIMNIMLVTVTERTKEIGTLKALGYTTKDVLTLFIVESIIISTIGGAIGTAVGIGIAYTGTSVVGLPFILPIQIVFAGVLISIAVGVAAGAYPANRAAKMNTVDALRTV
ncbi:ABC transporter permease [Methanimicrococcus blatticola]|uniref:Putative ABC transport system permease protein n=1 Tax=Methanimicrococcus blatticola TaxID=91560 RepID=A0A484F968_9EURY|nr:ABC transporter permease [Methanimicrococcus blatticola]MBZ3935134.1 ABC transporter permease [Methanimicrococcus blatticola]MCC2508769.1 ABC transporter permease [Methanimicrococcus blatticola]TDQ71197.1 putative ABC transport system permease protein [Methanimicrococcus blatticola]